MLHGESIVCFAPDRWGDIWRNRHRLLSVFARTNRVVYVEPRTTVRSLWRGLRRRDFSALRPGRPPVEEVLQNLFVYHDPGHLPRTSRRVIGPLIDRVRAARLRGVLRRLGVTRPILWLVRPDAHDIPGTLDEKVLLYQVVDDYLSYPGVTSRARERLDREERSIGARADLVVVTAEHLLEIKRHLSPHMLHVRNAVDAHTLAEGARPKGPLPPELASAGRPILGYIGGITQKLDLALLVRLAHRLESAGGTLALVGPVYPLCGQPAAELELLRRSPAVKLLGSCPPENVPMYLRAFDAGLIPYQLGDQARSIDPLKLYEYLAFGKPVVAVDIPSLRRHESLIEIAAGTGEFIDLALRAAAESDESRAARRRAVAAENCWEERAEQISRGLEAALRRKAAAATLT